MHKAPISIALAAVLQWRTMRGRRPRAAPMAPLPFKYPSRDFDLFPSGNQLPHTEAQSVAHRGGWNFVKF